LENVSLDLARLVDLALKNTKQNLDGEPPSADDVYAELLWFVDSPPEEGIDREWFQNLKALPPNIQELRKKRDRSFRSLLAYIGVRTTPTPDPGHVIVDEAQDIHPIEWEILGRLGNSGGWTILGDLNQRRTDHTFGSWDQVAEILAIENEDGSAPTQILERSYRSTSQIIRFANQLLPARDRQLFSLQQDGEPPKVVRVASAKAIWESAFIEAMDLLDRFPNGTVALITIDPQPIRVILGSNGWSSRATEPSLWTKEDRSLRLLTPDRARGLEFDAVVVIEPADFPENFGRQGVLYTALTRANRLLTIVNHRALPQRMKTRV
jgi:superfamily I DNA/RNA helicase